MSSRILIIEDETSIAELEKDYLELSGFEVELEELKPQELLSDWTEYIKGQCMENNLMAHNVRKKGKTLKGCIGEILKWSFENAIPVDKEIIKAAGIKGASSVKLGIPGAARAKKIITDYYMKKEK